jgi:hypothetical protein
MGGGDTAVEAWRGRGIGGRLPRTGMGNAASVGGSPGGRGRDTASAGSWFGAVMGNTALAGSYPRALIGNAFSAGG